ncbi:MAG: hypothetical protein ACC662_01305, partial [Planctomycetota bacterium]
LTTPVAAVGCLLVLLGVGLYVVGHREPRPPPRPRVPAALPDDALRLRATLSPAPTPPRGLPRVDVRLGTFVWVLSYPPLDLDFTERTAIWNRLRRPYGRFTAEFARAVQEACRHDATIEGGEILVTGGAVPEAVVEIVLDAFLDAELMDVRVVDGADCAPPDSG